MIYQDGATGEIGVLCEDDFTSNDEPDEDAFDPETNADDFWSGRLKEFNPRTMEYEDVDEYEQYDILNAETGIIEIDKITRALTEAESLMTDPLFKEYKRIADELEAEIELIKTRKDPQSKEEKKSGNDVISELRKGIIEKQGGKQLTFDDAKKHNKKNHKDLSRKSFDSNLEKYDYKSYSKGSYPPATSFRYGSSSNSNSEISEEILFQ